MWALRILSGPQMGLTIPLKQGKNLVGRSPQCDLHIPMPGVSKEHAEIQMLSDKIMIVDLRSSNGTFVNGVKVQNALLRIGDKVSFHDIITELVNDANLKKSMSRSSIQNESAQGQRSVDFYQGASAPDLSHAQKKFHHSNAHVDSQSEEEVQSTAEVYQETLKDKFNHYIDNVALPGVYKLAEIIEFKMLLLGFIGIYIFTVTLLSMFPMVELTNSSIEKEGARRAQSMARNLAQMNQKALLEGTMSSLTTHALDTEEGVKQVMIIQHSDGMILAPASRAGTTPNIPFIHSARREAKPVVAKYDSTSIGASYPIGAYNPISGESEVKAHAVIIYDTNGLGFDEGRTISLFMETLVIASVIGFILYFFMYKLIEFPISSLNRQLDVALRDKKDNLEIPFQFPVLQSLISNLNSLLTRTLNSEASASDGGSHFHNRDIEAENLIQIIGYPALAINKEGRIINVNSGFEQLTRLSSHELAGKSYNVIPDMALQQNIASLIDKSQKNPQQIHKDQLEFSGHSCILSCQGIATSEIDYFLIVISQNDGGG